jgi:hypothetical protein
MTRHATDAVRSGRTRTFILGIMDLSERVTEIERRGSLTREKHFPWRT